MEDMDKPIKTRAKKVNILSSELLKEAVFKSQQSVAAYLLDSVKKIGTVVDNNPKNEEGTLVELYSLEDHGRALSLVKDHLIILSEIVELTKE